MKYLGFTGYVVNSPIAGRAGYFRTHFKALNGPVWGCMLGMN